MMTEAQMLDAAQRKLLAECGSHIDALPLRTLRLIAYTMCSFALATAREVVAELGRDMPPAQNDDT